MSHSGRMNAQHMYCPPLFKLQSSKKEPPYLNPWKKISTFEEAVESVTVNLRWSYERIRHPPEHACRIYVEDAFFSASLMRCTVTSPKPCICLQLDPYLEV
jgi:hypothetical protein